MDERERDVFTEGERQHADLHPLSISLSHIFALWPSQCWRQSRLCPKWLPSLPLLLCIFISVIIQHHLIFLVFMRKTFTSSSAAAAAALLSSNIHIWLISTLSHKLIL